jgi:hypothetical protein
LNVSVSLATASCVMFLPCFLLKSTATLRQLHDPGISLISIHSFDEDIQRVSEKFFLCMKTFAPLCILNITRSHWHICDTELVLWDLRFSQQWLQGTISWDVMPCSSPTFLRNMSYFD